MGLRRRRRKPDWLRIHCPRVRIRLRGVIFGSDLVYLPEKADWKGDKTKSFDTVVKRSGDRFTQMVKNTYRVLLTRGMKGCYVHFMDKNTENLFRSRVEHTGKVQ